jgi:hypothetical protein
LKLWKKELFVRLFFEFIFTKLQKVIERINIKREPLKTMDAIYFLNPTSMDQLLKDFEDPKEPQYGDVHLFFTSSKF